MINFLDDACNLKTVDITVKNQIQINLMITSALLECHIIIHSFPWYKNSFFCGRFCTSFDFLHSSSVNDGLQILPKVGYQSIGLEKSNMVSNGHSLRYQMSSILDNKNCKYDVDKCAINTCITL